ASTPSRSPRPRYSRRWRSPRRPLSPCCARWSRKTRPDDRAAALALPPAAAAAASPPFSRAIECIACAPTGKVRRSGAEGDPDAEVLEQQAREAVREDQAVGEGPRPQRSRREAHRRRDREQDPPQEGRDEGQQPLAPSRRAPLQVEQSETRGAADRMVPLRRGRTARNAPLNARCPAPCTAARIPR